MLGSFGWRVEGAILPMLREMSREYCDDGGGDTLGLIDEYNPQIVDFATSERYLNIQNTMKFRFAQSLHAPELLFQQIYTLLVSLKRRFLHLVPMR